MSGFAIKQNGRPMNASAIKLEASVVCVTRG